MCICKIKKVICGFGPYIQRTVPYMPYICMYVYMYMLYMQVEANVMYLDSTFYAVPDDFHDKASTQQTDKDDEAIFV